MPTVAYIRENTDKCWCGKCPVQHDSQCPKDLYRNATMSPEGLPEDPNELGGMYCATGKATCTDLKTINLCYCPSCLVWAENELGSNHYCVMGSAEETGR